MEIGAQLFTTRKYCKTLEDFAETLKKVADMGYPTVQVSGTCPYEPQWLKEQLDKNGLRCVLTHPRKDYLLEDAAKVAENHHIFGCGCVGLALPPDVWDLEKLENGFDEAYKEFKRLYKPVAQTIRENGCYLMYHNHATEFHKVNGKAILEHIAEAFSPEELGFTLDTYWIQVGGGDPAWWIEHMHGRSPCIHIKDCGFGGRMEVIGEGNMNFDRIFEKAESSGVQYMLVEQDNCNNEDPLDCLKRSYDYLRACGF